MPNNSEHHPEKTSTADTPNLPVLAKDNYYLSRLERELARIAVSKNKATNQPAEQKTMKMIY